MDEAKVQEQLDYFKAVLTEARDKIQKQDALLKRLTAPPLGYATVISTDDNVVTLFVNGNFIGVNQPSNDELDGLDPEPGDTVIITTDMMQIVSMSVMESGGSIGYVRRVIDDTFSEVEYEAETRVVFNGKLFDSDDPDDDSDDEDCQKKHLGDRIILDRSGTVIVRNLGKQSERFRFKSETTVTWDDIGGLVDAKQQMIEAVELPHRHPKIFKFYNKQPIKGVLLYGPAGCGKTMLGKAAATALARIYKSDKGSSGFFYVKGPEILDKYVGVAEMTIRQLFQQARKHHETMKYPAVIFIDEADSILARRGSGISSDIERTIVPMFLAEMDGLEQSGALVILATNRPDILDTAIIRDGRIDRKINIGRPTPESAATILNINLKRIPLHKGYSHEELAECISNEVFSPKRVLYTITKKDNSKINFNLGHIASGAMIVNMVEHATSIALQRDLEKESPEGLYKEDLLSAVSVVEQQNRSMDHTAELSEFVHDFRDDIAFVQKFRQATA